jgi:PTS system mannose-specific IIA component
MSGSMATAQTGEAQVGLVIVTHAGCGDCLLSAAEGIVGPVPASTAVGVMPSEAFDEIVRRVGRACDEVDSGVGILILADVHGSSPFRACLAMVDGTRPVEIVAGVNLPMLIKLATCDRRGQRPVEVAELVKEVGKRSIRLGSELTGKFSIPREDHH